MIINRQINKYMLHAVVGHAKKSGLAKPEDWTDAFCKKVFGLSRSCVVGLFKDLNNGYRSIQLKTLNKIIMATGVRFHDMMTKYVNFKTYQFDKVAQEQFKQLNQNKVPLVTSKPKLSLNRFEKKNFGKNRYDNSTYISSKNSSLTA